MKFVAIPGLPLSTDTREAWRSQGALFPRRERNNEGIIRLAQEAEAKFILNLGRSAFFWPTTQPAAETWSVGPATYGFTWNNGPDIYDLLWPGNTRRLFDDIMPERPTSFPTDAWVKTPGYGGRGKYLLNLDGPLVLPEQWDWQRNVDGDEFRLITVGSRVVQQFKRSGSNGSRSYTWLPSTELPTGLRRLAKDAASRVPGRNVLAWDLIVPTVGSMGPLLFEGNSCPGVNPATAERIVREITRQQEEELNA